MLAQKSEVVRKHLEAGTGAAVTVDLHRSGPRTGLRAWFQDLDEKHGPVLTLLPHGLRGFKVSLEFGVFSGDIVRQIGNAPAEDADVARALVGSIPTEADVRANGQPPAEKWSIRDGAFRLDATWRYGTGSNPEAELVRACQEIGVPILAAMAELIGYDYVDAADLLPSAGELEGAIKTSLIKARERNPRNRLLALRLHGYKCAGCGLDPLKTYGVAGNILEVHHLQPLSTLDTPRAYDPRKDLLPLCPCCHRAVHTTKPVPLTLRELRRLLGVGQ